MAVGSTPCIRRRGQSQQFSQQFIRTLPNLGEPQRRRRSVVTCIVNSKRFAETRLGSMTRKGSQVQVLYGPLKIRCNCCSNSAVQSHFGFGSSVPVFGPASAPLPRWSRDVCLARWPRLLCPTRSTSPIDRRAFLALSGSQARTWGGSNVGGVING